MKFLKAIFIFFILVKLLGFGSDTSIKRKFFNFMFISDINLFSHLKNFKRIPVETKIVSESGEVLWTPKDVYVYGIARDLKYMSFFEGLAKAKEIPDDFSLFWKNEENLGSISVKLIGFEYHFKNRFWERDFVLKEIKSNCHTSTIKIYAFVKFKEQDNSIKEYLKLLEQVNCE